ncbi:class A sortase [Companilactobacillus halodurans]|uniref:Class A sortase n=1 Tax=Companilactobacillus halodurans TaxID=2584183 RepID=A0A5P0ZLL4_9LACO|nr:class A sortase [Companilactobacillus halodurans]MQS75134.1 class A sortase [Companilactobacillus halodurans]MQS97741.1 class A sortase [Companilactobacillus halodurans]
MKKFFSIFGTVLLLLIALVLIFNQPIKEYAVKRIAQRNLTTLTAKKAKANSKKSGQFDFSKVKPISASQVAKASVNNDAAVIGKMAVPSVDLKLPIVVGLSDNALSTGGGTMKKNQKMGKSNYALAGHYMTNKGALFSPLENAQIGDLAYITNMKRVYTYKIYYKKIVPPTAVYLLDDVKDQSILTLITCADGGTNRWALQGSLVSSKPANKKTLAVFS